VTAEAEAEPAAAAASVVLGAFVWACTASKSLSCALSELANVPDDVFRPRLNLLFLELVLELDGNFNHGSLPLGELWGEASEALGSSLPEPPLP
jgi:hypothetical protein